MRHADRFVWLLIAAVALAASVCGHSIQLAIENLGLLGEGRADYAHPAQLFAIEMAGALFLIASVAIGWRLLRCALHSNPQGDCLIPALDGVVHLGFMRAAAALVTLQFTALIGSELIEQRWAGFNGGLASIVGAGHGTAIAVHVMIGVLFAFCLHRVARFICRQTRILVGAIALFARRITPLSPPSTSAYRHVNLWASARKPPLLALGLANRPPPHSFANAA
jgi:hypothetical protein